MLTPELETALGLLDVRWPSENEDHLREWAVAYRSAGAALTGDVIPAANAAVKQATVNNTGDHVDALRTFWADYYRQGKDSGHLSSLAVILDALADSHDTAAKLVEAHKSFLSSTAGFLIAQIASWISSPIKWAINALIDQLRGFTQRFVDIVESFFNEIPIRQIEERLRHIIDAKSPDASDGLDPLLSNLNGEKVGGINPDLPTDLATLQKMLDAARASGADPKRYAALLQQYWLAKAAQDAGIDLNKWDPKAGVHGNMQNILNVYKFYGKLFLDHPKLQWAGMANMIGPSFAAGFMDLDDIKNFAQGLGEKIDSLPPALRATLPPEMAQIASAGSNLSAGEMGWFEDKFLAMQKHIFIDQGSMHEAYVSGGIGAIEEMHSAGLIDDRAANAWHDIDSGDPNRIQHGNADLLYREQNQVISKQYDQMYQHDGPVGAAMTYGMTAAGDASIPGTQTPAEYNPLTIGTGVQVETPLPAFNVADRDARWDYVTHDTLPAYQRLLHDHPDQAQQIIASPVEDRIAEQRLAVRSPRLADAMITDWGVKLDTHRF